MKCLECEMDTPLEATETCRECGEYICCDCLQFHERDCLEECIRRQHSEGN